MRVRDARSWMWTQALELLDEAEQLSRQFFEPGRTVSDCPRWHPPVDVIETDDEYWVLIALPGVAPQRVHAQMDDGVLLVRGDRAMPAKHFAGAIRRLEIPYGQFERRIPIPPGRFEVREQRFDNGCLVIGLRRLA